MSVTPQELLEANGIKLDDYAPGQHSTTCPNCSPKRVKNTLKCLSVLICDDGKTVCWHCHHCGWSGGSGGGPPSNKKTYDYLDADGRLLFQKVRNPPGSKDRFYCRRPDGKGGWISNLKGIKIKPLYRWHEVKKAKEEGREIALVEGEKDADNLWALGIAATCNFDGAADVIKDPKAKSKWKAEYSEQLRGAHLVVFNDNDSPGYAHADHICRASINVAARVRRLDLALHWLDMPKGDDVSDYLVGHTREELVALIAAAPDYAAPEQPTEPKPNDFDAEIARLAKLSMLEYEQQRKAATDKLDVRASILDKLVQAERVRLGLDGGDDGKQGHAIEFTEIEPWPEPVNGAELLDEIATAVRSYVVMVNHFRDTCALWSMHTYLIDRFFISPRLGIHSPVKRCGKTTLLDVLSRLVA